jgi:cell division protein FtsI/penicillin-binding protein 2
LVFASVPEVKGDTRRIAEKLAPFFVDDQSNKTTLLTEIDRIVSLLTKKEVVWVPLEHKVNGEIKRNIEALKISGIGFEREESRVYPEASAAAHLLGFVGKGESGEDIGYFGLEGYYNLALSGKPGFSSQEKDARGIPILLGNSSEISAIKGVDLITHIDKTIQLLLEKRLLEGIQKYGAKGGTVIVANPETGAILGMTSYPSYEPDKYWNYGDGFFKNPAISETFEPGSVFKILVMAAALDAGAVEPDTICDICSGPLKIDKYTIETWNQKYRPDSDMTSIIVNSDNVGMAFVAQKLGADKLYDYLNNFGIGKKTEIDLQGEDTVSLREKGTWNIVDLSTAGFGQGVAVTPIQLIKAASAIANGGTMITPQVVAKLQGEGWEETIKPQISKRVLSAKAVEEIKAMMVEAAKSGESKWTNISGFKVAGKTGTAQIPIAGHYDVEKTIASFIGFAPADKPKFIMLVTLKEPQSSPWASETAAPLWYSISKDLFPYLGIQPE